MTSNIASSMVPVLPATRFGGVPSTGWTRVAIALRPYLEAGGGVVIVEFSDAERLIIECGRRVFWWDTPLTSFPERPTVLRVQRSIDSSSQVPFVRDNPGRLDSLLWLIGNAAFPAEVPWWRIGEHRYRLTGWPNFTELIHEPDHVRMTALLSNTPMSVSELAVVSGVTPERAQQFLNALDMTSLVVEAGPAETTVEVAVVAAKSNLFARLRARMGR